MLVNPAWGIGVRRGVVAALGLGALALWGMLLATVAFAGGVTSTTAIETYAMEGNTPLSIVSYFHTHPFPGDRGPALANIRYNSDLDLTTREGGGRCRVASVRLNMDFVVTLPSADEFGAMSRSTRAMWNQLAAFARAHEFGHRAMDLQCAWSFVARAERLSGGTCEAVESAARDLLAASAASCDAHQAGYDQRESVRAGNLAMFRAARLGR